jgi:hypothetical protein
MGALPHYPPRERPCDTLESSSPSTEPGQLHGLAVVLTVSLTLAPLAIEAQPAGRCTASGSWETSLRRIGSSAAAELPAAELSHTFRSSHGHL